MFCFPSILQKVLEHFSHSSSRLILAQILAPFECLHFPWCNFSCKFLIIGLNSGLRFSCKVLSLYLSQEILIFSCKVLFLEKDGNGFLVQGFTYSNQSLVEEKLLLIILSWKSKSVSFMFVRNSINKNKVVMIWKGYHNTIHFSMINNF